MAKRNSVEGAFKLGGLAKWVAMTAAVVGATGTKFLFIGAWGDQPQISARWGSEAVTKEDGEIAAQNEQRELYRVNGLGILLLSLVRQGIATII